MKRSQINALIEEADAFIREFGFVLPPFANLTPDEMVAGADAMAHVISARMGWDITDYGKGAFDRLGLVLFTLRNGRAEDLSRGSGMCYAEKLLISRQDQLSPMHRHHIKAEDIINRGGARLAIELFGSAPDGALDPEAGGTVLCDGVVRHFQPGEVLTFRPGESITLMPGDWHAFWGDGGDVLIGEVSTVNDDETDNWFVDQIGRFSQIDEDVSPVRLLVSDYPAWFS